MTRYQIWIAFRTIALKEIDRVLRLWPQSILPALITSVLYFLIFGKFVGSQVGNIQGFTYVQYIMPGLIMMPIITNAYLNTAFSFFSTKFQHAIEEMLVSPMPNTIILCGFVAGGVVRAMLIALFVTIVSLFFTDLRLANLGMTILIAFLTALLFSLAGLVNGVIARKFDDAGIVPTFILTPLTYLGGVFYSIHELPPFAQRLSRFNPIFYIVSAFRHSILGISDVPFVPAVLVITGCSGFLLFLGIYMLRNSRGLRA